MSIILVLTSFFVLYDVYLFRNPPMGVLCLAHNKHVMLEYENIFRGSKTRVICMTTSSFKLALARQFIFPRKEQYTINTSNYFKEQFITKVESLTKWSECMNPQVEPEFQKVLEKMSEKEEREFHVELAICTNKAMT